MTRRLHRTAAAALMVACLALSQAPAHAQERTDFSGAWVSTPRQFTTLRDVPRERGWNGHLRGVEEASTYRIAIVQTADSMTVTFPAGSGNFLTRPTFALDGEPQVVVEDHGDWWTKFAMTATWDGPRLTLQAKSLNGWWRTSRPEDVTTQASEVDTKLVFSLDPAGGSLTMTATVSDEKGEAEYVQVFDRAIPTPLEPPRG